MDGAQGRNRTTDTAIFSRMLYQLSYLGSGQCRALAIAQANRAIKPGPANSVPPSPQRADARLDRRLTPPSAPVR